MSDKELKDKLRRKNKIIEEQQLLLDEYRNTIKFLEIKIKRWETKQTIITKKQLVKS